MNGSSDTAVVRWFGAHFSTLHPLLQALHRHGGRLHGMVEVTTGKGLAGWLGRRFARSLGIPLQPDACAFSVSIEHQENALLWIRRFDKGAPLVSRFEPVGAWPDGYWRELTGAVCLDLTVEVVDRGWQWRLLRARLGGVRVPLWLLPGFQASKHVEHGTYVFQVQFSLPWVGKVLGYGGTLEAEYSA